MPPLRPPPRYSLSRRSPKPAHGPPRGVVRQLRVRWLSPSHHRAEHRDVAVGHTPLWHGELRRYRHRGHSYGLRGAHRTSGPRDARTCRLARASGCEGGAAALRANTGRERPTSSAQSHDRDADRRRGQMMRNERRVAVRSGELTVGVLERATHGDETWAWFLTGLHRPDDHEFIWQAHADSEQEAFESFA